MDISDDGIGIKSVHAGLGFLEVCNNDVAPQWNPIIEGQSWGYHVVEVSGRIAWRHHRFSAECVSKSEDNSSCHLPTRSSANLLGVMMAVGDAV